MVRLVVRSKLYIVVLLSVLVLSVWTLVIGSMPVSGDRTPVRVVIPTGAPANRIASILSDRGLIRSRFTFVLTCRMSGTSAELRPGVYEFTQAMNVPEIIERLVNGDSLEAWVVIPEGFTLRQIADRLDGRRLASGEAFSRVALEDGQLFAGYSFLDSDSLEGYLFPDTYLIARGTDPKGIITKMLDAFEEKALAPLRTEIVTVAAKRLGLGLDDFNAGLRQILTMASLIEREAKVPKDRALISAVLWNRLAKGMRLQVDATVSYVPGESGENKPRVYYGDLDSDSAYNTYKHAGLPPGPICNPGIESMRAALRPAARDYLYYVARKDGSHVFTRTYEEHKAAIKAINSTSAGGQ